MSNKALTWSLIAVVIIAVIGLFTPMRLAPSVAGTRAPNGLSADNTLPVAGQVRGTTLTITGAAALAAATLSGTLTQSTSNTATTTAALGCIQTVATSTVTPIRLEFGAVSAATTTFGSAGIGSVVWRYGTCP